MRKYLLFLLLVACQSQSVQATPTGNDIYLSGIYGSLTYAQVGTQADPVIIDGSNAIAKCVQITGQWIILRGLTVAGCNGFSTVGSDTFGIFITGKNIVIENNTVYNSGADKLNGTKTGCVSMPSSGWGSGIKVKVGGENITIRNNKVYENCGEGIAVTRGINVLVENNIVYDNYSMNIYVDNSNFVTVKGNQSYCTGTFLKDGNRANGIGSGEESYSGWGNQRHDNTIINNTVTNCRRGFYSDLSYSATGKEKNLLVEGNVFIVSGTSISLNGVNENVVIRNNQYNTTIYVLNSAGVTLSGNVKITNTLTPIVSTATKTPTIIFTVTPSRTPTRTPTTQAITPTPRCDPDYLPYICIYKLP